MPSAESRFFKVVIRVVMKLVTNDYYHEKYLRFVYSNVLPRLSPEVPGVKFEEVGVSGIPGAWPVRPFSRTSRCRTPTPPRWRRAAA